MHARAKLRIVYAVDGRPDVMTRAAAYRAATAAAVSRRCDCYIGSGPPDDHSEPCAYHAALCGYDVDDRRLAVLRRLAAIYKAEDAKVTPIPEIDMSHLRKDELESIQAAIDWHLQNGAHKPARKKRRAKE